MSDPNKIEKSFVITAETWPDLDQAINSLRQHTFFINTLVDAKGLTPGFVSRSGWELVYHEPSPSKDGVVTDGKSRFLQGVGKQGLAGRDVTLSHHVESSGRPAEGTIDKVKVYIVDRYTKENIHSVLIDNQLSQNAQRIITRGVAPTFPQSDVYPNDPTGFSKTLAILKELYTDLNAEPWPYASKSPIDAVLYNKLTIQTGKCALTLANSL